MAKGRAIDHSLFFSNHTNCCWFLFNFYTSFTFRRHIYFAFCFLQIFDIIITHVWNIYLQHKVSTYAFNFHQNSYNCLNEFLTWIRSRKNWFFKFIIHFILFHLNKRWHESYVLTCKSNWNILYGEKWATYDEFPPKNFGFVQIWNG